jgi:uncharacterized membrane protein
MQSNTSTKFFSVLCYLTVVGWIISFLLRDKEDVVVKHHLNQGLILILAAMIFGAIGQFGGIFGLIRWVGCIAIFVYIIMGIARAFQLSTQPLPLIGDIRLVK